MIIGQTECGMKYAVRRSTSSVGYCALSIKCGTRDEDGYHSGIAHFTEHTIFKGTSRRSSSVINSYLDKLGGELNAFTTKEEIVFHATVLKEDLGRAASLLFELATSPSFPENEIEKEKSVVIDEINSYKDSPSEDIYDKFEEMLFKGHPLSKPILGTASSVKKINRDELARFVKEKFVPSRMAFSVVANIDEARMEKEVRRLAEKFFKGLSSVQEVTEGKESETLNCNETFCGNKPFCGNEPFDKCLNKRNHQANCIIGGLAPSLYMHRERLATVLLCNVLGGPASNSILNSVLREKNGWVYGVECTYTQYKDTGIAAISIGCDKDNLEKCIREIEKELAKLQSEPLTERKLRAAKKQLLGQIAISSDNGETQCLSMGKGLMDYGRVTDDARTRELVESISAQDVQEMACKVFDMKSLSRLIYL